MKEKIKLQVTVEIEYSSELGRKCAIESAKELIKTGKSYTEIYADSRDNSGKLVSVKLIK